MQEQKNHGFLINRMVICLSSWWAQVCNECVIIMESQFIEKLQPTSVVRLGYPLKSTIKRNTWVLQKPTGSQAVRACFKAQVAHTYAINVCNIHFFHKNAFPSCYPKKEELEGSTIILDMSVLSYFSTTFWLASYISDWRSERHSVGHQVILNWQQRGSFIHRKTKG